MRRVFVTFMLLVLASLWRLASAQTTYNVPSSGSQTVYTCDAWIYDFNGPTGDYFNNWDGYLVIYPSSSGSKVSITSGSYDVESGWDHVYVYNGVGTGGPQLADLTGNSMTLSVPVVSTDPTGALTVRFKTDGSVYQYDGFELHVQCVEPVAMSNSSLSNCAMAWMDPGGMSDYSNNQDVTQTICSDNGDHLSVNFTSFSLLSGDYLYVYDGNSTSSTLLGSYTGTTLPSDLVSSGDCLTFRFTSNSSGVSSGWMAGISCAACFQAGNSSGSPCLAGGIHPFCTDEGQYTYCSGVSGSAESFFGTGSVACLYSTPAPAWYFMRIDRPGSMTIHIEQHDLNGSGIDVDFACWGPFSATSSADFVNKLCSNAYNLSSHLVDCSYSAAATENCDIYNAQVGQYYLLLITNYSQDPGVITFNSTQGSTATTDCSLMAEVSNDGPYCVGDTIHLFCNNPQSGASYLWTGPNGWSSTDQDPVIYPATVAMNGNTYSLVTTLNGTSSSPASTTVTVLEVNTSITVNPANATICRGSSATLMGSNISGYQNSYSWSPGGQHNRQISVSPTSTTTYSLTQTVNGCEGHASVTVTVLQPQHQSYTVDTCANSYTWHNYTFTHAGTYTRTWSHQDANGCTQVDTLHLTMSSPSFTRPLDGTNPIPCARNIQTPQQQLPTIVSCGGVVPLELYDTINNIQGGCGYYRYVYHYTVAGTVYTWNYTYYLQPPTFTLPQNQYSAVQCLADAVPPVPPVVVNSCGDTIVPVVQPVSNHSDGCTGYVAYPFHYSDCSGHSAVWTYTYLVADTTPPVFVVPADKHICRNANNSYVADASVTGVPTGISDNCVQNAHLFMAHSDRFVITAPDEADTIIRTWSLSDSCNNVNSQIQKIVIHPAIHVTVEDEICEGELYDSLNFSFMAVNDTTLTVTTPSLVTGCDSITTLNLTVHHPHGMSDTVEAIESYTWHGTVYQNGGTMYYTQLDLNGCEQIDTLHLTLYYPSHTDIYDTACVQYSWYGQNYTVSGDYNHLLHDIHGADSLLTLHLTILGNDTSEFSKTVCFFYEWQGMVFDEAGDYTLILTNSLGCDSVVTLHLSIQDTIYEDFDDEACNVYHWHGKTFTETGDYEELFNVAEGCDSLVTLHLTVYYDDTVEIQRSACESYEWNDVFYTQSGEYEQHFQSEHGCDSLVRLQLTIYHATSSQLDSAVCVSAFPLRWNGALFNGPGSQSVTLVNAHGCDSMVSMAVTVIPTTYATLYDTIVENALPYDTIGLHFTSSGWQDATLVNARGCDSIVTMHLTVLPNVQVEVDSTVCENDLPVRWNGAHFAQAGTQSVTFLAINGVDSVVVMTVHVKPNTYATVTDTVIQNQLPYVFNGIIVGDSVNNMPVVIPNAQGCDSVISYSLFVWRNVSATADTAVCEDNLPIQWNGVVFADAGDSVVTLTGAHGVDSVLLMRVHVNTLEFTTLHEEICMSDFPYRYINGQIDTTFFSSNSQSSIFNFQFYTVSGCDSMVTLELDVVDTSLRIVSSGDFCSESKTVLTVVSDLTDYMWSTGETSASIDVVDPGIYSVTASLDDCKGRAFLRIQPCKMELRLPNAFSPSNSDGLNDVFRLPEEMMEQIEYFEITIFNRWGNPVFHSKDKHFEWHGDYNGKPCDEGVYSYSIKLIDTENIMHRMRGSVMVL